MLIIITIILLYYFNSRLQTNGQTATGQGSRKHDVFFRMCKACLNIVPLNSKTLLNHLNFFADEKCF